MPLLVLNSGEYAMPYSIVYKDHSRNWGQHLLEDYFPGLKDCNERFLDAYEAGRWALKKRWYAEQKAKGVKNLRPLRRGRIPRHYPSKTTFNMDDSRDIAEVKQFPWFAPCWHQDRTESQELSRSNTNAIAKGNLDVYVFPCFVRSLPPQDATHVLNAVPRFRHISITTKNDFCSTMKNSAWQAIHRDSKSFGLVCYLFYLNSFDSFDTPELLEQMAWHPRDDGLPSDIIKFELHRLLQGFITYEDYFRMMEMIPNVMDHLAINVTHQLPSPHRFHAILRKIGSARVRAFFNEKVDEARHLGLIRDQIHIWDGQFHETWLKDQKTRKPGLEAFYGGVYNHGGKKVGTGVQESTLMDFNGECTIPIFTESVLANKNDNIIARGSIRNAYMSPHPQPVPVFNLTDRGPFGERCDALLWQLGSFPLIPLPETVTQGVRITANKGHHFYKQYVGLTSDEVLEKLYDIRTRIEEHYSLHDTVYRTGQLHCTGKEVTEIEIFLTNTLGVLVPLTAYKIGRPDWMWSPTKFRSLAWHPEDVFPEMYQELNNFRWDDTVCKSSKQIKAEREAEEKEYQK
jgi:hypothetical protein